MILVSFFHTSSGFRSSKKLHSCGVQGQWFMNLPVAVVLCPGGNHKALITDGMTHTTTPAVPFRIPPTCDRLKLIRPSISRNTFTVEVFLNRKFLRIRSKDQNFQLFQTGSKFQIFLLKRTDGFLAAIEKQSVSFEPQSYVLLSTE